MSGLSIPSLLDFVDLCYFTYLFALSKLPVYGEQLVLFLFHLIKLYNL